METVRFAARMLRRSPLFSLATIAILAVGIGANTAMFSIVSAVLLRPLPFADPDQLVVVSETRADAGDHTRASAAAFLAWQAGQEAVDVAAYSETEFNLTGGEPLLAKGSAVSANTGPNNSSRKQNSSAALGSGAMIRMRGTYPSPA